MGQSLAYWPTRRGCTSFAVIAGLCVVAPLHAP